MKLSLFAVVGLASVGLATPAEVSPRAETAIAATDRLLFSSTLAVFLVARNAKNPASLDWTSDGCTASPDNPFGFDYVNSCYRHDFGYRNNKAQNRFTAAVKAKVDTKFKNDMYNQCESEGGVFEVAACKGVADVYYEAVKKLGSKRAVEFEETMKREMEMEVVV